MATPPRWYLPGVTWFVTRRTTQRLFLLKPDPHVNDTVLFILGCCAERYEVELHGFMVMSNHIHLLATDRDGQSLAPFMQLFFSLVARSLNAYHGRWENFWSAEKANVVLVPPRAEDLVHNLAYMETNPVQARLVSHATKWRGAKVLAHEIGRVHHTVQRPAGFFDPDGDLPESVTFTTTLPPSDVPPEELRAQLVEHCHAIESGIREEVRVTGGKFLGLKRLRRLSVRAAPSTQGPRRTLTPHVSCKSPALRVHLLLERKFFIARYRVALGHLRRRVRDVLFPAGTYHLARFCSVECEPFTHPPWANFISPLNY